MSEIASKIEHIKISELKVNPDNPRVIKDDQFDKLVESIKQFPRMLELRPVITNDELIVLGGNKRLVCAAEAGLDKIPYIKASDLTEEQQKEFIIKDNVSFGEWDYEILADQWDESLLNDWGLDFDNLDEEGFGTDFSLDDSDRQGVTQMTFVFSDDQAEVVKGKIAEAIQTDEYEAINKDENPHVNGNAIYTMVVQWEKPKK